MIRVSTHPQTKTGWLSWLPTRPRVPIAHQPSLQSIQALALLTFIALLWHITIAHSAIAAFAFIPWLLKLACLRRGLNAPPQWSILLLSVLSMGLIIVFYGGWNGQTAGISFVALLLSLKFLESRSLRDYLVTCIVLLFLSAAAFLFNSSIVSIVLISLFSIGISVVMQLISQPAPDTLANSTRVSIRLFVAALPIAVLLFFFFPRLQGDFGFLPSQDQRDSTGQLQDSLVAGELAVSAFDNSLAFRAEFPTAPPPTHERYWRAKVLTQERNFQWIMGAQIPLDRASFSEQPSSQPLSYTVLHEATRDQFLPHLDYLDEFSLGGLANHAVIRRADAKDRVLTYQASASRSRLISLTPNQLAATGSLLRTETQPSTRMRALLQDWTQTTDTPIEKANRVFSYFRDQPFSYSLLPPVLNQNNALEDFLFNTRTGYCEHYASAFTTLMRWLDVPARVVVGYQGGSYNVAGSFVSVRYSDAHAWSEIWDGVQWVRMDPTAAVSPERIEFGMEALLQWWDGAGFSRQARGRALADYLNPSGVSAWLRQIQSTTANLSYQWNKWVVNYDFATQQALLLSLGAAKDHIYITLIAIIGLGLGFFSVLPLFMNWLSQRKKRSPEQRLFEQFSSYARRQGIEVEPTMTPRELLASIEYERPHLTGPSQTFLLTYERLRYHSLSSSEYTLALDALKQTLNHIARITLGKKTNETTS